MKPLARTRLRSPAASIPDHVVGAPLKPLEPGPAAAREGAIPDHVVGAPLKRPRR